MPRRSIFLSDDGKGGAEQVGDNVGESDEGSLSEASDHTPSGVDETSSHPEDPIKIQSAKAAAPTPAPTKNKPSGRASAGGTKKAAAAAVKESDDEEAGSDSENESSEESDKNDDDDYQEGSSDSPEEEHSDDLDYGETTRKRKAATKRIKAPSSRKPSKRPTRKPPAKKPTKPAKTASRTPPGRGARRGQKKQESSDEQEEVSSEESGDYEEDYIDEEPRGRRTTSRGQHKSPRRTTRGRRNSPASYKVVGSSGEESDSEAAEDNEEENDNYVSEEEQPKRSLRKKQSAPKKGSKRNRSVTTPPQNKGRPARAGARSKRGKAPSYKDIGSSGGESSDSNEKDDDNENEEYEESEGSESQRNPKLSSAASSKRPSRSAAAKATARMAQLRYKQEKDDAEEEEHEDDKFEQEEVKARARKRRKVDSDEEDFEIDEEGENDDDDAELEENAKSEGEESFLKGVASVPSDSQVGNADSSDFCEDEMSDNCSPEKEAEMASGQKGLKETAAAAFRPEIDHSSSDDDDEAEIEPTPTKGKLSQQERTRPVGRRNKKAKQRLLHCPSTVDAITEDPLPPIHVCYVSPDGKSRQCFSLETIHKIATTSQHPQTRTNLNDEQQLTFLQPPHFRSAMSDELLDQIASRFGRQALDLNGHFYNGKKDAHTGGASSSSDDEGAAENEYQVNFTRSHTSTETFNKAWRIFQMKTMGNQDIYPCPVCYATAHHRVRSPREDQIALPTEFSIDPMAVLGSPDNSRYKVAAGFCFTKIAQVKEHLRKRHHVDTARIDSALFYRFKIRAPDGLLQRYLAKSRGRNPIQGDMTRYWYNGNSEEYIYLLYQMEKLREEKDRNTNGNNDDESGGPCREFCDSFQDQALDLWEQVRAPFSGGKEQDMSDFLADGDDEEEEGDGEPHPHHVFDQEKAAAEQQNDEELARFYAEKAAENEDDESGEEEEEEEDYECAADASESESESESEEDEWVAKRTNRKRPSRFSNKNRQTKSGQGTRKSARKQRKGSTVESSDEELDEDEYEPTPASKRAVFEESDSD